MSAPSESKQASKFLESMYQQSIDGLTFIELISASLEWLRTNQATTNALNVFPVPDGDTGTNMVLTMQSAYNDIASSPEYNVGEVAGDIAQGALMGARGNSGVILSQILRGFARSLEGQENMDGVNLAEALAAARDTAYKGVVRPVEGTILTVVKDMATAANKAIEETQNLFDILELVVAEADASVERTP
ncbi:MAG: DAK2 domain-containing protein, partial [Chloroflexota bacterium]|nr:DAK2 domain-containing protein [Chloroflexota bacterium]